jgi:hypothetical protein
MESATRCIMIIAMDDHKREELLEAGKREGAYRDTDHRFRCNFMRFPSNQLTSLLYRVHSL